MEPTETLVSKIATQLKNQNLKLITAESCTGGGLAYQLTNLPGSSSWFDRGIVSYSNQAKIDLLKVRSDTLNKFGAVSAEVANEMALGALANSNAQITVAITGIAGPDGGTEDKPVGTVWFSWQTKALQNTEKYVFKGTRQHIREQAINIALQGILKMIMD